MKTRIGSIVLAGAALLGAHAYGCGSTAPVDVGGGDGGDEAGLDGAGGDGSGGGGDGGACQGASAACATNADCCSNVCDSTTHTCNGSIGKCAAAGAACTTPTQCCSVACENGACSAQQCTSDGQPCTTNTQCCGGVCSTNDAGAKTCAPLNATCKTSGNACTANDQCCSKLCSGGTCQLASSYCIQSGDVCTTGTDCCGGVCTKASGATLGTCALPPSGSNNCSSGVDGTVCGSCNDCCSRVCAPYATGVLICQPANGCHIDGDLCQKDSDCCGGTPGSGLPGAGNVTCEIPAGYTVGRCRNPLSCNPEGNVCHYLGGAGSQYACTSSSARNDCCEHLGSKTDCTLDPLGVPRCHVIGVDGGQACRTAGQTCAFSGDCCNGTPCVPGANGQLVCYSGPSGSDAGTCVPVSGPCTVNADCCPGGTCNVPLGSTQGTCAPLVPPPGTDAGSSGSDAGAVCSLYGQQCVSGSDCCNGVPCTASDTFNPCNGGTGCTCTYPIPR